MAAIYAGRLVRGPDPAEVARAARRVPYGPVETHRLPHAQLLLRGLAVRLTDGYRAAAPLLKEALARYRAQPLELDWLCASYNIVAMDLWDDEAWFDLADGQVRLARTSGTLSWLPFGLDYLAELHIQAGELSQAAALLAEGERIDPGIRAATLPYVSLLLAAWRGDAPVADELARGAAARSRALVASGSAADEAYREAIELLVQTRMATHAARARLSYGEWLRRENRRIDARRQLRLAFDALDALDVQAFAERARRELLATGEKVRKRHQDPGAELTPQEREIARLAGDGRTNSEIGAQLFIGARTVEWHLRKVFTKLDIGSRRELDEALRRREVGR